MKTKLPHLTTTLNATLAVALVLSTIPAADGAYWNRNRNRWGNSGDNSGDNSSGGNSSGGNSRGRDLDRDGIPNIFDPDIDNDGIPNGEDRNVDGGVATSGPLRGRYIGDRLPNNHPAERDIDDDGLADNSPAELDIDGDGIPNASDDDIDGDGIADVSDDKPHGDDGGAVGGGGPVGNGTAPAALTGLAYAVKDANGNLEESLNFTSTTGGTQTDTAGDVDPFTYTFTPNGTTASLRLQFKPDKWDEYDLNYTTGAYVRREYDKNVLVDTDTGTFNLAGVTPGPGTDGGTPVNGGTAPAAISSVTWVVKQPNGVVEANLVFTSATAGSENDPDGDIDPFTYVYAPGATTATLRLDFKPGEWDEYDLDFATGRFTRREFKNSALDDADTGTFANAAP